jgi:hypothetical protein
MSLALAAARQNLDKVANEMSRLRCRAWMCPGAGPLVKSRGVFSLPFARSPLPKACRCWQGAVIGGSQVRRSNQCSACHGRCCSRIRAQSSPCSGWPYRSRRRRKLAIGRALYKRISGARERQQLSSTVSNGLASTTTPSREPSVPKPILSSLTSPVSIMIGENC